MLESLGLEPWEPESPIVLDDRRAAARHAASRSVLFRCVAVDSPLFPAVTQNVSSGGFCLALAAPLKPGTLLDLRLPRIPSHPRSARVIYAVRDDEDWLIGCRLDRPLSDEELAALRA